MSWSTAKDFEDQLRRLWERGDLLRPLVMGDAWTPRRLKLTAPSSGELSGQFDSVRSWLTSITTIPYIRIEWRDVNHRVLGAQRLPNTIWVDTLEAATSLIGRRGDLRRFVEVLALTRHEQPSLVNWLSARPLLAIELAAQWPNFLKVVNWITEHPRPGIYLRQVDIPGIHSKFIERYRGVLCELFDLVLPEEAVSLEQAGVGKFSARYGFLGKPVRIRFRVLDDRVALMHVLILPDITLDSDNFARLDLSVEHVFITENETNFLAFPPISNSIVIFGAGYGWQSLGRARWLSRCSIHYWGDIDTHGFAILDQLRRRFDHVESFLMDHNTLLAHKDLWGEEADQVVHDLPNLTEKERALFDELRDNRIQNGLRLEQEYVSYQWFQAALVALECG
ncbi:Wadjet anti-phage system protein JetD domain-containing protein [Pseudomonas sp. MDT2-39-1]